MVQISQWQTRRRRRSGGSSEISIKDEEFDFEVVNLHASEDKIFMWSFPASPHWFLQVMSGPATLFRSPKCRCMLYYLSDSWEIAVYLTPVFTSPPMRRGLHGLTYPSLTLQLGVLHGRRTLVHDESKSRVHNPNLVLVLACPNSISIFFPRT